MTDGKHGGHGNPASQTKPTRRTASHWRTRQAAALCLLASVLAPVHVHAQGLPLIRDSEIENLLNDYAKPLFRAAGLGASGHIAIRIVNNDQFNAFVLDGHNIFVHTGALLQAKTPNEVIGVIAHESGHITGGHLAALRARIAKDQTRALLSQILGIGLLVAGGVSGGDGGREIAQAGQGVLFGGNETVMRGLLAERRNQESAADQAGLKVLEATHQSGQGMLTVFEGFSQQEYISDAQKDIFARTHPAAADRLARLRELVIRSAYAAAKDPPALQLRHDLMRAKLAGYLERTQIVLNRYPLSDTSLPGRYARAIAHFLRGGDGALETGLTEIDALIRENPANGYFWEVKADMLTRSGKVKEAIPVLRQALKLVPDASLIRTELAAALQNEPTPAALVESIDLARRAIVEDEDNPRAFNLLATAYYKQGREAEAYAMTAQSRFLEGNIKEAQNFAKRAQIKLKPGTPEWLKNDDILNYKPQT